MADISVSALKKTYRSISSA